MHGLRPYLSRLLIDGLVLSALFSAVALVSLWADPVLWLDDYPPDVRDAVGDSLAPSSLGRGIVAIAFLVVIVGGLVVSLRRLDAAVDGIGARAAGLYAFALIWIVNAIDVLVVDWLFFMNLWRRRVTLPGTEGLAGYDDYLFHLKASFLSVTPWVGSLTLAAVTAGGWWWLVVRRRTRGRVRIA